MTVIRKQMLKRIAIALEEEERTEPDLALLDQLRAFSALESFYLDMAPERRNALNDWFAEVKDLFFRELLEGNFGTQILLDTFFVLCLEVGYRLAKAESAPTPY